MTDSSTASPIGLSPWEKITIMSFGASAVGVTLLLVICIVGRHCWINDILRRRDIRKQKESLSWPLYGTNGSKNDSQKIYLWKKSENNEKSCSVWLNNYKEVVSHSSPSKDVVSHPTATVRTTPSCSSISSGEESSRISLTSAESTTMSIKSAFSSLRFKNRFRNNSLGDDCSSSTSQHGERSSSSSELSAVNVGLYWRIPSPGETCGKLTITVMSCSNLPRREYGGAVESFIHVSVLKDRGRSLRRRNSPLSLSDWKTKTIRNSSNPVYDQTFTLDIAEDDFKNIRIKMSAFDCDRHTKTHEIGSAIILLREIKLLTNNIMDQKINTTSYLSWKKEDFGELLFGMSYLPTAQRMSFSIVKATNLKYEAVAPSIDTFFPYVRILHIGSNHKVIKKKKTSIKVGKRDMAFNETLNFEVPPAHLESSTFVILLNQKVNAVEMREVDGLSETAFESMHKDDQSSKDICLGMISIGRRVSGEKERTHWLNVVQNPRKVFSTWQTFH